MTACWTSYRKARGSRSINDLPRPVDSRLHKRVFDAVSLNQIDVATQKRLKILGKPKKLRERRH